MSLIQKGTLMFKLNHTILVALLAVVVSGFVAAGASAAGGSGAVVFSRATLSGDPVLGEYEGGLFAANRGRLNQLTEDPTDSEPDFSPDGRWIAFVRDGDVWKMRADGSGQQAVTSGAEIDGRPLFAPNGRYLLFERRGSEAGRRDLYTVRADGSALHQLVYSLADEREATFAPNGRAIAFVIGGGTGAGATDDVYSVRPSGARLRRLTRTGPVDEFAPRFFRRGIVFSRGHSGDGPDAYADIYTALGDGRKPRPLVRGAGSAYVEDVTANGRLLLFRRAQGLWVKPLPSGRRGPKRARKLTEVADQSTTNAVFSSDGRKVAAFVATEGAELLASVDVARRETRTLATGFSLASGEAAISIGPVIAWQPARQRR